MNRSSCPNNNSHHAEYQSPIIRQENNTNDERIHNVMSDTKKDDHIMWLMATPKVSSDESDRHTSPDPSCAKKIKLSPPPLLPSSNKNTYYNQSLNNDDDSVISLPSLDRFEVLQKPVFRLKKRKSIVGGNHAYARWRLRHRTSSDPLDYLIQPSYPQQQQQQRSISFSTLSSAQEPQLPLLQRAVSFEQHGKQPQQPQQSEEGTEEEEDELKMLWL